MEELVKVLSEKFGIPINAVWADVTAVLERFVSYKIITNIIWSFVCFAAVGICLWVIFKLIPHYKQKCETLHADNFFYWVREIHKGYDYRTDEWKVTEYKTEEQDAVLVTKIICWICIGFFVVIGVCCFAAALRWKIIPEIEILNWINMHK